MKVAQLTLSVSRDAGGLLDCVRGLARRLQDSQDVVSEILGFADAHTADDLSGWQGLSVQVFPRRFGFIASEMTESFRRSDVSLAHTHGLWSPCSPVVQRWHRETKRPYLVSPQGMLDAWALRNSRWKKRLAALLFERGHLKHAACLHAVCQSEVEAIRAYGLKNAVCVIPNGVELPPDAQAPAFAENDGKPSCEKRTMLFLGRLHPKKGLPTLLKAWSQVATQNPPLTREWQLKIAGWNQGTHALELQQLVNELKLTDAVEFIGPVFGESKAAALRAADVFVLPSFSEGLPLSVLEAWSYRLPVLMTPECNVPEGFAAGAAFRADPNVDSMTTALVAVFSAAPSELATMGERGLTLVGQKFTWSAAAKQMAEVYRWLATGGTPPGCVNLP